jgi:hypothetical protein
MLKHRALDPTSDELGKELVPDMLGALDRGIQRPIGASPKQ